MLIYDNAKVVTFGQVNVTQFLKRVAIFPYFIKL